jgi:hypothetical protein
MIPICILILVYKMLAWMMKTTTKNKDGAVEVTINCTITALAN